MVEEGGSDIDFGIGKEIFLLELNGNPSSRCRIGQRRKNYITLQAEGTDGPPRAEH